MVSEDVEIVLVMLFVIVVVILAILGFLVFCYEWCCHDDGYKYKALPYEDVESVSLNNNQWTTNKWKQPNDNDTIIDLSDEIKKTVSCSVCERCSRTFERAFNIESSFCPACRLRLYASIYLSDEVKSEVMMGCLKASLDRDIYFQCKKVVITTLKTLLEHPSNRGLFSKMPDREGSTKAGLKTRIPVEFDFSVTILLQDAPTFVPRADIENENKHSQWGDYEDTDKKKTSTGCTVIKLGPRDERRFKECCEQGVLSPTQLLQHFKSFLSIAIKQSELDGVKVMVQREINGPAVRLVLQAKHLGIAHHVDIDVTPKVVLSSDIDPKRFAGGFEWPRLSTKQFLSKCDIQRVERKGLYFVPKSDRYWCLSFANYENEVLNTFPNDSVEKKMIRCMKVKLEAWQTQSRGKLNEISSYLLKEVFFWLRESMPNGSLWTSDKCAERYFNFVAEIRFCFAEGHLPSYFDPTINLLKGKEKSGALMIQYLDKELKKYVK